ncbi:EAL domain-containing protein [Massilia sp. PAMC28688]|uniref:sensor domain-containing protein n=1 Tax=Massilia sp. PAMC28688 TaxID=2861283 RepID=UPI001C628583|nr:bifunctional diguanylate cyclase/phosphodiesterase [Massilia sp. PAMC28688]QYF95827.1 EAL domain-containing protein [Massilia sp. PAMC28688]
MSDKQDYPASFCIAPGGRIVTWNAACQTILGHTADAVVGKAFSALLAPALQQRQPDLLAAARLAPQRVQGELVRADGTRVLVYLDLIPQWKAGGRLSSINAIARPACAPVHTHNEHELLACTHLIDVVNMLPGTFYVLNTEGRLVLWNQWVEKVTQHPYEEIAAMYATDMFKPGERDKVAAAIGQVFERDGLVVVEADLLARDGSATPFLFTGSRFTVQGKPYLCGMGLDISARREQEEQLRLRERALHASSNGIFIVRINELSNTIVYVNPAFERITGYRSDEVISRDSEHMCDFLGIPGVDDEAHGLVRVGLHERRETRVTFRNQRKDGGIFWNELTVAPVRNEKGEATHFIGVINDVTESKQRTTRLEHEINHDVLTGLANRNLLWDRLEQALFMAQRNKSLVAVILVDLDNFKIINDTWGHDAGDQVLKVLARKMLGSVRDSDTVARLGGDEFVLVLVNQPSLRYTLRMISRLRHNMDTAVSVDGKDIPVQSSMGVSVFPHDGQNVAELMRAADTAMYHAKLGGRNDVQFFSADMKAATDAKLKLENMMRHAVERDEMFLLFQPKLSLATGRIVGAEVLLRWRHPEQGVLLPSAFLLEAEESGQIVHFGEWVFGQVCDTLQRMKQLGFADLVLSMNVSFRELSQRGYLSLLAERLGSSDLSPASFELEITEASLLRNAELTQAIFDDIARLGIKLTIDEFGAGVSSLKNLHMLPVTNLKIFKSYVGRINSDNVSDMMAKTIIGIGHLMNMGVIGEGVETLEQRDFLIQHGCDQAQGNFFSHPVTLPVFEQLLADSTANAWPV